MGYKKELDKMVWSYSRLHSWELCPYFFYLKYIEKRCGIGNFYASNGKIVHEIFDLLSKKEMNIADAPSYYYNEFDLICEQVSQSTMNKTYEKVIDYLCTVDELDSSKYEIIGSEVEFNFKIRKYDFIGYADLIIREIKTGNVILIDHKSSNHFYKKDGTILANQKSNYDAYKNQMYLYCIGMKEKYGFYPNKCCWHHFKDNGALSCFDFCEEEIEKTKEWALNIIKKIYKDTKFVENKEYFRCKELCDFRDGDCEYLEEEE